MVNSFFANSTIQGVFDGTTTISHCKLLDVSIVSGLIEKSILAGTVILDGTGNTNIIDCYSGVAGALTPVIDFNGSGSGLIMRNYSGGIELTNKSGVTDMSEVIRKKVGIIMNGVTGRMGTNQHLLRSIVPIIEQGGVELEDGTFLVPDPILVGRNQAKLEALVKQAQSAKAMIRVYIVTSSILHLIVKLKNIVNNP